ncbi:pirin family protein [Pseudoroseomonas globiformis]|uniref:Pirin family protein n=1 Tax=Teichococcus globiformis TaxID=2307229 RepID=A0ABV7G5Q5_9PROT
MIEMVIDQRRHDLGGGFEVGRVLPFSKRRMIGPFIFFDHMGPTQIPAGVDHGVDVRPHPHVGLSTVSYLFSGEIMHRDSLGYEQAIRPQEVNWMVAGRGITHSERLERARLQGDRIHGIQAWVALPKELEETAPSFSHYSGVDLPQWDEAGVRGHLIAGSAYGLTAATKTHSPLFYAHLDMAAGASAEIPAGYQERALYIATGEVEMDGRRYGSGKLLVVGSTGSRVRAFKESTVMVLGGEPVGERFIYWNFVSSSKDRLRQAASEWRAGGMKLPDADDVEFIPLPDDTAPSVRAIS